MNKNGIGIRSTFRIAIFILATLAFLVVLAISFKNVSDNAVARAEASICSEVDYLCLQLSSIDERREAFERIVDSSGSSPETLEAEHPEDYRLLSDPIGNVLEGYTLGETGTVAIIVDGVIVSTDDARLTIGGDARDLLGNEVMDAIDESLQSNELQLVTDKGVLNDADGGIPGVGKDEAYLLAGQQGDNTVLIIEPESLVFKTRGAAMKREALEFLCILIVVFFIVDRLLVRMVARRIDETNEVLDRIAERDLSERVESKGASEFRSLSAGINKMVDSLEEFIAEAETRMDAELATAKAIQESALPNTFPPFPDIPKFDIYASMNAARQIGGDFYDFFLVGDDCNEEQGKLGFVIADVSGKGVPAALFMMKAKALIRNYAGSGMELGEAVSEANRQILDGNNEDMFVTAWVGVLDYGTRHIDYVNAGHNPPLLRTGDKGWEWMRQRSGPVLGLLERSYRAYSVDCAKGDMLLLYTDGVTEAFDVDENQYGEERLQALVEARSQLHPRELLKAVRADVATFAAGSEQSDDITIMALEVGVPPVATAAIEVPAEIAQLNRVNEFLHDELDHRLCPKRVQNQLDIAVEELFVNVCSYAYLDAAADTPATVRIQYAYSADPPHVTVDLIDSGVPFDPLAKPDAVTPKNIEDVPIGGLGILMAKKFVDEMRYERVGDTNVVTLVKKW